MLRDPAKCWRRHRELALLVREAEPNAAHRAIVDLERKVSSVVVITQNVDGLHARAGSSTVIEIHGGLSHVRCTACDLRDVASDLPESMPRCARCGHPLRFDIVLFDEMLPAHAERAARDALRNCTHFYAVGTSGVVWPAAGYAREADFAGARTTLINLEPPESENPYFHDVVLGRAEEILPTLW